MALNVLSLLLLVVVLANPSAPQWPPMWAARWNLHSKVAGRTHYAEGWTAHNEKTGDLVWSTSSAWSSEACKNSVSLEADTECRQVVHEGRRYIYYPSLARCCQCSSELWPSLLPSFGFQDTETYFGKSVYTWQLHNFTYFETRHTDPLQRQWTAFFSPDRVYTTVYNWTLDVQSYDLHLPQPCIQVSECLSGPCSHASGVELKDLFSLYSSEFLVKSDIAI